MSGGQLLATDILWTGGSFEFTGGEIYLNGDRRSILNELWFNEAHGTVATYDDAFNQTHLTVVPEPSAALSLLGGAALIGLRRRRRA